MSAARSLGSLKKMVQLAPYVAVVNSDDLDAPLPADAAYAHKLREVTVEAPKLKVLGLANGSTTGFVACFNEEKDLFGTEHDLRLSEHARSFEVCEPTSLTSKRNSQCACFRPSDSLRENMMCSSLSIERSIRSCFERANGPIETLSSTIQCCSPSCSTDETIGTHFGYVERSRSNGRTTSVGAANSTVRETVKAIAMVSRVKAECLGRPETAMEIVVAGSHSVVRHFRLSGVHLGSRSGDRPRIMMTVVPSLSMFCVGAATVSLRAHQ